MHENVTTAAMVALSTVAPRPGKNRIVCLAADFPSTIYLYRAHEAAGFELTLVPAETDLNVREDRIVEAIDERTAFVSLSHVLFKTSFIVDPRPVVRRAHEVGARVLLDGYQSAGIIPVDVTALGVDFFAGGCLKWLCGGPGTAYLYTRPASAADLSPRFTGWFSHRAPFAFDTGRVAARADAMRMMNGTPSIPAYYAALPGLDIIRAVGVSRIREQSVAMTSHLLALADRYGFPSVASRDPDRVAGTVAVNPSDALQVSRALKARDVVVDYRPGVGIRVSPHFYNTIDEIDRLMAEMASIVEHKAYDAGGATQSLVT
jgi:kynureninase